MTWFAAAITVAAAALTGCADKFLQDVDLELEQSEVELLAEAYIQPGDTSYVFLDRTYRIDEEEGPRGVPGATVRLLVDGEPVTTFAEVSLEVGSYYSGGGSGDSTAVYVAAVAESLLPVGARVRLEIAAPDGMSMYSEASVPPAPRVEQLTVRPGLYGNVRFSLSLDDAPGPDGYLIEGERRFEVADYYADADTSPAYRYDTLRSEFSFETGDEIDYFYHGYRYSVSDESFDGSRAALTFDGYAGGSYSSGGQATDSLLDEGVLRIATVDPLAVEYLRGLALADWNEGNPFVEPVILPTSFVGGRGMLILKSRVVEARVALPRR